MIHAETQTIDLEQDDRVETIVVGLRYTGPRSSVSAERPRQQGGWPGRAAFQGGPVAETDADGGVVARDPGPIQIGVVPDTIDEATVEGGTLPGLENLTDFEVLYDPADLAAAILETNYLPPVVFGGPQTSPDYAVRERVFEALDIPDRLGTAPAAEQPLREALAETAGIDLDEEQPPDKSREEALKADYTRNELLSAAGAFEFEDLDKRTASKTELAERLAREPPGEVRDALGEDAE